MICMDKAVIYIRVSTEDQTEESQREPCLRFCKENNWEVVDIFKDHAKSAYHNVKRPGYDKVWDLIRKKQIKHIVVWAMDRWCRKDPDVYHDITLEMEHYGVQLHPIQESWIEEINAPGYMGKLFREFFYKLMAHFAHEESRLKSERVKTSKKFRKAVEKGRVGRPGIPESVRQKVLELLKEGKSYSFIQQNVTYKAKYGKVKHVSAPTISEIKKSALEKGDQKNKGKISNESSL